MKRSALALVKRTGWPILRPPRGTARSTSDGCSRAPPVPDIVATMATPTTTTLAFGDIGAIAAIIETFQAELKDDGFLTNNVD